MFRQEQQVLQTIPLLTCMNLIYLLQNFKILKDTFWLGMCHFFRCTDIELGERLRCSKQRKCILKTLVNSLVVIERKDRRQIIKPIGIDNRGANEMPAYGNHRQHITVQRHYEMQGKVLKYSYLPLIIEKPSNESLHVNYYPVEKLIIIPSVVYNNSQWYASTVIR